MKWLERVLESRLVQWAVGFLILLAILNFFRIHVHASVGENGISVSAGKEGG